MAAKSALRGRGVHLSPEIVSLLVLPAALAALSGATALLCLLIHWS